MSDLSRTVARPEPYGHLRKETPRGEEQEKVRAHEAADRLVYRETGSPTREAAGKTDHRIMSDRTTTTCLLRRGQGQEGRPTRFYQTGDTERMKPRRPAIARERRW